MSWMAWTLPSALFFVAIGCALVALTLAEVLRPSVARRGFLRLLSTRGDRFFISLLGSALLHVAWLGLTDASVVWMSALCVILVGVVMRWG